MKYCMWELKNITEEGGVNDQEEYDLKSMSSLRAYTELSGTTMSNVYPIYSLNLQRFFI